MENSKANPTKSIFELTSVKLITVLSFISAGFFIAFMYNTQKEQLHLLFKSGQYNDFVSAFIIPISIIQSAVFLVGFIALNHRSEQTKLQIDIATKQLSYSNNQNAFNNYFKHKEEFIKILPNNFRIFGVLVNPNVLHDSLFPNLREGDYSSVFSRDKRFLYETLNALLKHVGALIKNDSLPINELAKELESTVTLYNKIICMCIVPINNKETEHDLRKDFIGTDWDKYGTSAIFHRLNNYLIQIHHDIVKLEGYGLFLNTPRISSYDCLSDLMDISKEYTEKGYSINGPTLYVINLSAEEYASRLATISASLNLKE